MLKGTEVGGGGVVSSIGHVNTSFLIYIENTKSCTLGLFVIVMPGGLTDVFLLLGKQ